MKNVLILGAGLVARPMVEYLLKQSGFEVTIASRTLSKAEKLVSGASNGRALELNVDNSAQLEALVKKADLVVSLLPYTYHVKVAEMCLAHSKQMVTTSYVSPAMKALDARAKAKGIIILNEIGLDPGIDHMSAMRIIHDVRDRGGRISAFRSYCGGLPAPDANDNPWGYKFSWSPRGVLMAGRNNARFQVDDKVVEVEGKDLFNNRWPIKVDDLQLETYPNRDSIPYVDLYGIKHTRTMYRGTLRFPGWSRTMYAVSNLGMLAETEITGTSGFTHAAVLARVLEVDMKADLRQTIADRAGVRKDDEIISKLDWLDIFSNDIFEQEKTTPIDFLAYLMLKKMQYAPGQRDLVVLHHDFIAEFPDKKEHITSTLVDYGIPNGDSSMSRTVSLPAAIAVRLILEGKIKETGVHIPVIPEIYNPVLDELEKMNIICREVSEPGDKNDNAVPR